MLDRQGPTTWLRNAEGRMEEYALALLKYESVLSQVVEPHRFPEVNLLRQTILAWRFYHHFRTDAQSPLRFPQIGAQTNVLSHDGSDLAAALETVLEIGDESALAEPSIMPFAERVCTLRRTIRYSAFIWKFPASSGRSVRANFPTGSFAFCVCAPRC